MPTRRGWPPGTSGPHAARGARREPYRCRPASLRPAGPLCAGHQTGRTSCWWWPEWWFVDCPRVLHRDCSPGAACHGEIFPGRQTSKGRHVCSQPVLGRSVPRPPGDACGTGSQAAQMPRPPPRVNPTKHCCAHVSFLRRSDPPRLIAQALRQMPTHTDVTKARPHGLPCVKGVQTPRCCVLAMHLARSDNHAAGGHVGRLVKVAPGQVGHPLSRGCRP